MAHKYFLKKEKIEKGEIDFKKHLNQEQQEVVFKAEGPCLVLAGPGSGKTRTLIYRLAYLLEKGVSEKQILLMTFTKKASEEMINRTQDLIGYQPTELWAGTFHHIANLTLRKEANKLGYDKNYTILDSEDSLNLIKNVISDLGSSKEEYFPKPRLIKAVLERSINTNLNLEEAIDNFFPFIKENAPDFNNLLSCFKKIKESYNSKKKEQNLMDFNDLLTNWLLLLKENPDLREEMDNRFKYVLVDEFQDTSPLQNDIIHLLSKEIDNVLVVGDDSQSIYSFRGATIDNIFKFKEVFNPKIFKLETNYRSTDSILQVANNSIKKNERRFKKTLRTKKEKGSLPAVIPLKDSHEQAQFITQRLLELNKEGVPLSDIGILYRSHFHSGEIELELARKGIPYIIRSGIKFHERKHIKDILSFFRVLLNSNDELSWRRILELKPGIGKVNSNRIFSQINQSNLKKIKNLEIRNVNSQVKKSWKELRNLFAEIIPLWDNKSEGYLKKITNKILNSYYKSYLSSVFENPEERLEDIEQLSLLLERYQDVERFLSDISLSESFSAQRAKGYQEGYDESVVLSTVHQAKGLEWNTVFVIGLIEGWFPHWKSNNSKEELEEERRIFYVAVTRAKENLYLTFPLTLKRTSYEMAQISSFIKELDSNLYQQWEIETDLEEENESIITYD